MARPEFTLIIVYRVAETRHKRVIPWNWYPSGTEVFGCITRLREQIPNCEVVSATLTQEVLVHRYNVMEEQCES